MKKIVLACAAVAVSFSTVAAEAGGWGGSSIGNSFRSNGNGYSSGLLNISPTVGLGDVNLLGGSAILSGNRVSGILNGNTTGVVSGVLSGIGNVLSGVGVGNLLGSGNAGGSKHRHH